MATFSEIYDEFVRDCEEKDIEFDASSLLTYPLTEEETKKWSENHMRHDCYTQTGE